MCSNKYPIYNYVNRPDKGKFTVTSVVTQEIFDSAINYQPKDDDIFVATYPKNGTTWMLNIIIQLVKGIDVASHKDKVLSDYFTFLEFEGAEAIHQKKNDPRIIKTHLPFEFLQYNPNTKYIFVVRNPKDCVASFYYHTVGFGKYYDFENGKFDDFFQLFIDGKCDFEDYFEMVSGWYKESKLKNNICFFLYEDMKDDLEKQVRRLANFLGPFYESKLDENDHKLIKEILKTSSINYMKKYSEKYVTSKRLEHLPFIRKGVIGDWKNLLSNEQSEIIDKKIKETADLVSGFDLLWTKYKDLIL